MVIVEKSFPRGGVGLKETKPEESKENIIFGALQKKIKKTKTKAKDDIDDFLETEKQDKIETVSAELLNYDTIQDGMNIMGMVKALDQLYLTISLPGRMVARVSALEISDSYTKATSEFLKKSEQGLHYKPLNELYRVGQIVYGKVMELKQQDHGHRTNISLSLKPSEVHSELSHLNVKKGFIFNGAIEEVQEHGYIIESGIKGLRVFMPLEQSQAGHVTGELVYMKVEKITKDSAASTCICKEIKAQNLKIKNQADPNLEYILPSTIVNFNVTKKLKDGLKGTIMNEAFTAYINEHQLTDPLALPEDFELKSTLSARVLYVMPLTKFVYLSLNMHNDDEKQGDEEDSEGQLKRGDVVENAKVDHLGTGGVVIILNNKFKGVISYKTIKANYKGNYDQDELLIKYAKKTQHKVRILDYDLMDSLYICTDDANIVNEKVFDLSDLKIGEFVMAEVTARDQKVGGYKMQIGKMKGIIEKLFLAPSTKPLEEKAKVRCRILAVCPDRKVAYLTNRPEYMSKTSKILTSLQDAKENATFLGTIVKCDENLFIVKFFNNLKGILHKPRITGYMANELDTFYEGQTINFRIASRNDEKITLTLPEDTYSLGEICPVSVTHILDSGLEIKVLNDIDDEGETKGLIPIRLLSDFVDLLVAKLHLFKIEDKTQAVCVVKNLFSLRDVDYFKNNLTKDWRTVQPGDIIKAFVKNVEDDVVHIMVPVKNYEKLVKVHLKMLLMDTIKNTNIELMPEQVVYVKVLSKEQITKTLTISAKLTDVWDGQLSSTAKYIEGYLREVKEIKKSYKKQIKAIAEYSIGQKVTAKFKGVDADTQDWHFEVLKSKIKAIVKASMVGKSRPPKVGEEQECSILWIDYGGDFMFVTNKAVDMERITSTSKVPPNLVGKSGINAKVLLILENIFICSLKKGQNPLVYCPMRVHFNDFENSASVGIKEGEFCKLAFIHDTKPIAVLESTWKLWQDINRKRKIHEENAVKKKKAKLEKLEEKKKVEDDEDEGNSSIEEKEIDTNTKQKKRKLEIPSKEKQKPVKQKKDKTQNATSLFYEDKIPSNGDDSVVTKSKLSKETPAPAKKPKKVEQPLLPGVKDFWTADFDQLHAKDVEESSDEEDEEEQDPKKKKKLTAAEKFKQQREEETRLREIEEKYADPNQLPETTDQFDRLVISEPNNSKHWINYMVFYLQSTEIEKARAVARRAIKAISFRDVDEHLNVWMALLNLELRYGAKDSFDETFKEALTYNDPIKVYMRTIEILTAAQKKEELVEMIGMVTKKFKQSQDTWRVAANAFFSINMPDRAQQLLHKALACLPERDHVNTIVMFANLNHKHGNNEMAQTLLDQIVTSYPKRVDVWTQYVDMLVKSDLVESARCILERAVIQKIPLKKMRTIFKKYLEFEERFGTEADVEKVKKLAADYVKNNANL